MMNDPTHCFLIDDDEDDQEIFYLAVQDVDESIRCIFANDGVHALEKLHTDQLFTPNWIFIDMNMPRMNGLQCLKAIRTIDRLKHTPVFLYSTYVDPMVVAENKKLGATDFIRKPSSITELTRILSNIFQNKMRD